MSLVVVERRVGPPREDVEGVCTVYGAAINDVHFETRKANWRAYRMWSGMVGRCYQPSYRGYKYYGGCGVYVSKRWLRLSNFLEDLPKLPNYSKWLGGGRYNLDKDYYGARVYDVTTCVFSPRLHNLKYTGMCFEIDGRLFITAKSAAQYLGMTQKTFRAKRRAGEYTPTPKLIRYPLEVENV